MVLLLLLSLASILLVMFYLKFRWRYRHILATANKLPCPPALPIFGNALSITGDVHRTTQYLFRTFTEYKKHFCLWIGPVPYFVISDPSDVQIILNSSATLEKDLTSYKFMKMFGGNGLITAPVSVWKKSRRLINPVFHPTNLENFLPVFNDLSRDLVRKIDVEGDIFDPSDLFFNATINAVSRTAVTKRPIDKPMIETIQKIMHNIGDLVHESVYKPWLHIEWISKRLGNKLKDTHQLYFVIAEYFDKLWEEEISGEEHHQRETIGFKDSYYKTLLDVSMENPSIAGVYHNWRDERHTMLAAGSETVTSTLSFMTIILANHQDVQDKIYREILQGVEDPNNVTLSDLKSLAYLEQVLMECMRLYPSVPIIFRKATRDTKLSTFTLPVGSRVLIPLYGMGRNEDQFPDPERFLPDRFSPDASRGRHPYASLPFSGGPRNCIGKTYAMLLMKTVMVHLLNNYKLHSNVRLCDIQLAFRIVHTSSTELLIRFENR